MHKKLGHTKIKKKKIHRGHDYTLTWQVYEDLSNQPTCQIFA